MLEQCGRVRRPGRPGGMAPGTGGVAFRLVWQQPLARAKSFLTPSFNACVDRGIGTIAATVSDGTTTVSASWPCSAHEGLILGVPAGTNYTVQVNGISSGATIWSGLTSTITVNAGQITDAGTIVMGYVGGDTTQPTVISIDPHSSPTITTNVPATDRFSIVFDEPMAISTITAANITLKLTDNTPLFPGTVSYDRASNTAAYRSFRNSCVRYSVCPAGRILRYSHFLYYGPSGQLAGERLHKHPDDRIGSCCCPYCAFGRYGLAGQRSGNVGLARVERVHLLQLFITLTLQASRR